MRIGVDGKPLLPPRAGVARYLEGLLAGYRSLAPTDVELDVVTPQRPCRTVPWVLWALQRATARGYAAFHFPFYYPPLAPRCPVTVAIHDVLVLEHPEWFPRSWVGPLRWLLPRGARRAAAVFTGSACVADAIVARCGVPRERIRLFRYGVDGGIFRPLAAAERDAAQRKHGLERPYLLLLGALEPRRGVDLAIAATAVLRTHFPDLELALAGEARARVVALEAPPPWLRRLGRVEDAELAGLFGGASAVLAPSRGEGFDLPLLEALSCGAPVVASDIPVHLEHFAGAVELFASGDAEALAAGVARVLGDSARAAALRAAGPQLAASYTWGEAARRHLEVWREVAAP